MLKIIPIMIVLQRYNRYVLQVFVTNVTNHSEAVQRTQFVHGT